MPAILLLVRQTMPQSEARTRKLQHMGMEGEAIE